MMRSSRTSTWLGTQSDLPGSPTGSEALAPLCLCIAGSTPGALESAGRLELQHRLDAARQQVDDRDLRLTIASGGAHAQPDQELLAHGDPRHRVALRVEELTDDFDPFALLRGRRIAIEAGLADRVVGGGGAAPARTAPSPRPPTDLTLRIAPSGSVSARSRPSLPISLMPSVVVAAAPFAKASSASSVYAADNEFARFPLTALLIVSSAAGGVAPSRFGKCRASRYSSCASWTTAS